MITQEEVLASVAADWDALEHIASLVYTVYARMQFVTDASGPVELGARIALADTAWSALDELGVDLNLPDLKTMVKQIVATAQSSSGTALPSQQPQQSVDRADDTAGLPPVPLEPTSTEDVQSGFRRCEYVDEDGECCILPLEHATAHWSALVVAVPSGSSEPLEPADDSSELVFDPAWKPGDACLNCGSTNTEFDEAGVAYCADRNARDDDE